MFLICFFFFFILLIPTYTYMYGHHHHLNFTTTLAPNDNNNRATNNDSRQGRNDKSQAPSIFFSFYFLFTYTNILYLKVPTFTHHSYHISPRKGPNDSSRECRTRQGKETTWVGAQESRHIFFISFLLFLYCSSTY